ncbi:MAG: HAMP domain-containing protein [Nitrospirae bacterium]|nr:HAMP domain-containing protein [Nitrospirota bacterium]
MKVSLKAKVSTSVALIVITVSAISTYFFISATNRSIEKNQLVRGDALSYSFAKAAEDGLKAENLDLIRRASNIVYMEDVTLVQVYSTAWGTVDAYPLQKLNTPPHPEAIKHFKNSNAPLYKKINGTYDFYRPIIFKANKYSTEVSIGFVRLTLSSASMQKELEMAVLTNIAASAVITFIIIATINLLINRFVLNPVTMLQQSVLKFKNGEAPEPVPIDSNDEIGELIGAFKQMEDEIRKKIADLERFYDMAVGREVKMKELKKEVENLKAEILSYKK